MKRRRKYQIRTERLEELAVLSVFFLIGSVGAFEMERIGGLQFLLQCVLSLGILLTSAMTLSAREERKRR